MGDPAVPTEHDISEAIEAAREAIEAVTDDEESWFDRVMNAAARGFDDPAARAAFEDEHRPQLFIMMQELVRAQPIVLSARAESRINPNCSPSLRVAVDNYENGA